VSEPMTERRNHIVLLGDSIFDNAAYTRGAPDVVTHLRRLLPHSWEATLCAVDGARIPGLAAQLARVPVDASHLVIAIGGNDALQNSDLLSLRVASSAQALEIFADRITAFERAYRTAITHALRLERHTAICTVYNGALEPERAAIARVGLALFNDVILRTAVDLRLDALVSQKSARDRSTRHRRTQRPNSDGLLADPARDAAVTAGPRKVPCNEPFLSAQPRRTICWQQSRRRNQTRGCESNRQTDCLEESLWPNPRRKVLRRSDFWSRRSIRFSEPRFASSSRANPTSASSARRAMGPGRSPW
jgi:hypothetical protein